jgi:predicted lipid-binding transport protein (Tim44 family)
MCIELHIAASPLTIRRRINTLISSVYRRFPYWLLGCNSLSVPASSSQGPGCHLTNSFGNHAASIASATVADTPAAPKKRGWLPLLTVLFLISYGLMTMLIVEQGQTIESQRALIRELFRDSKELSAVKKAQQALTQSPTAQTQPSVTHDRSAQNPSAQNPSNQNPSAQAPTSQAPSSQAGPQHGAQNRAAKQKPQLRMPSKPASDLIDDVRTLITI